MQGCGGGVDERSPRGAGDQKGHHKRGVWGLPHVSRAGRAPGLQPGSRGALSKPEEASRPAWGLGGCAPRSAAWAPHLPRLLGQSPECQAARREVTYLPQGAVQLGWGGGGAAGQGSAPPGVLAEARLLRGTGSEALNRGCVRGRGESTGFCISALPTPTLFPFAPSRVREPLQSEAPALGSRCWHSVLGLPCSHCPPTLQAMGTPQEVALGRERVPPTNRHGLQG